MWSQVDFSILLGWFAMLVVVTTLRFVHIRYVLSVGLVAQNTSATKRIFLIGAMVSSVFWGVGFEMFGWLVPESYRMLYLLVLGGMASGGVASMLSDRLVYAAYLTPMLLPAVILSLLQGDAVGYASGLVVLVFMLMLFMTHNNSHRTLMAGLRLRFENENLIDELSSTNTQLEQAKEVLHRISLTDALTGLPNRRHFDQLLEREWGHAQRSGQPISCLLIDIDRFKDYNDYYGHQLGDSCLQHVACILRSCVRRSQDVVARYGGEEFVAILPETNAIGAALLAEKMVEEVRNATIEHAKSEEGIITISIGVATFDDITTQRLDDLIKVADDAVYSAKNKGRNCMVIGSTDTAQSHVDGPCS